MRALVLALILASTAPAHAGAVDRCADMLVKTKSTIEMVWNLIFGRKKSVKQQIELPGEPAEKKKKSVAISSPSPDEEKQEKKPGHSQGEPEDDYTAHNKNTDTPPSEKQAEVAIRFNREAKYFVLRHYEKIDAATSKMGLPRSDSQVLPKASGSGDFVVTVDIARLPADTDKGYINIPFGFEPVAWQGTGIVLYKRPQGLYYHRYEPRGEIKIMVSPQKPRELSGDERARLTQVENAPALTDYPENFQEILQNLKQKKASGTSDSEIANELAAFIRTTMLYEVDESPEKGVLDFCARNAVQCDGATLILVTLLRSVFDIPCEAVGGAISALPIKAPGTSVILDQSTPHMITAVYDSRAKLFVPVDPTPSKQTREKENEPKKDERFNDWPSTTVESVKQAQEKAVADIDRFWNALFESAKSPRWTQILYQLEAELKSVRAQHGLPPDKEIMLRNVEYVAQAVKVLTNESLISSAALLSEKKGEDDEAIKKDYVRLQVLAQLAPYGTVYAQDKQSWRKVADTSAKMLSSLPKTRALNANAELAENLPGPFAREALVARPSQTSLFQQMARLHKKIKLARLKNFTLQPTVRYDKVFTPTDDDEIDYVTAEDFEHVANFQRNGLPPKYDAVRVFNDDMTIMQWRDPVHDYDYMPKPEEGGREVTFILFDLSSSMLQAHKGIIRDRLIQIWIDELMALNNESIIGLVGYRDEPEKEIMLTSPEVARAQFERMLVDGEFFKSNNSNDTHLAFEKAIELAAKLGPEYKKVNFRLITDGEETLKSDLFRQAKDKLGGSVELNITAVTLVTGNEDLKAFVDESRNVNLVNEGVFIHLSAAEIAEIAQGSESTEINRFVPDNYRQLERAPSYLRTALKNSSVALSK